MNCGLCQDDPDFKKIWGCEKPAQEAVWEDGENLFYSCPLQFIPDNILIFISEYNYNKKYQTNKSYKKQSNRYVKAEKEYEYWVGFYRKEVQSMKAKK
jgi:hypothetical protein